METTLKQRLIGTAVIIALAVIFVPMILDGSGQQESASINLEAPPKPKFTFESDLPDPKQLEKLPPIQKDDDKDIKQVSKQEEVSPETKSETKPETKLEAKSDTKSEADKKPAPVIVEATANHIEPKPSLSAWAVQVAAFGEKDKALALQEKLISGNYSAFTEKSTSGSKVLYRVKVGPELERENAESLRDKIKQEHGLTGSFVTNHP